MCIACFIKLSRNVVHSVSHANLVLDTQLKKFMIVISVHSCEVTNTSNTYTNSSDFITCILGAQFHMGSYQRCAD